jgi:hypothetical protein
LLAAGCATASAPPSTPSADTRAASGYRRCSPADPDRYAWFCVIGQIFYAAFAGFSFTDPGAGLRDR